MFKIANFVSVKPVLVFPVIFFSEILFAEIPADSVNPPPAYFSKGRIENGIYLTLYENPALTGLEERHNFQIKNTITGVDVLGSVNWLFFYDKGLGKKKKHNLGIGWEEARYGFINSSSPTISYAYNFQLGKYNHLRCALAVSYIYSHLDRNKLTYGNMIDKRYGFIYATKETYGTDSRGAVDFNGGLWYSHNKFYSGVSILHMDRPYTGYNTANQYRISTEVYFTGGYVFRQEKNFHLVPSFVLYRSYGLTTLTPTITGAYKNNILFGFSFRDFETISAELAANFYNRFRFFISCGIPIAYQMRSYSAISFFEASIRVQIGRNKSFLESYLK